MRISISSKILITTLLFFLPFILSAEGKPAVSKNGMVVTASPLATDAGAMILNKGGNAIDAAVAVGFALAVTYPTAGNLGGGGFMVIHTSDGRSTTLDFRETAPLKAFETMYLDSAGNYDPQKSQLGWKSAGVPGTVHGLITALEKYGTMTLAEVIQPAIDLAENGFVLSKDMAESVNYYHDDYIKYEPSKKIFTKEGNKYAEGDLFIQKDLAKTLNYIKENGIEGFYNKNIAHKFVQESEKYGGIFTLKDFELYRTIEREPVTGTYRGYKIISMGPPSSGGVCLIQSLNTLENFSLDIYAPLSGQYYHLLIETLKRVYADRSVHLGDPDFYKVPVDFLTSKKYGANIANSITDNALPSELIAPSKLKYYESEETTHYSIADKSGNAVSTTYTLNSAYGSRMVVDGLGFLLNNEMDDFSSKPGAPNQYGLIGSYANSIQPRKRMLSSMTPTIVLKNDKPFMVIGSPGGSTIITQVLQVIINVIDFKMNIYDAIDIPRIHHQWLPDEIYYEKGGLPDGTMEILTVKGHKFGTVKSLGRMEGIIIDTDSKTFYGASDPRAYGKASGE